MSAQRGLAIQLTSLALAMLAFALGAVVASRRSDEPDIVLVGGVAAMALLLMAALLVLVIAEGIKALRQS